jgi:hypothetical protein
MATANIMSEKNLPKDQNALLMPWTLLQSMEVVDSELQIKAIRLQVSFV